MRIALVSGSHRRDSQSRKVARFAASNLALIDAELITTVHDLAETALPLWDEGVWNDTDAWKSTWGPISRDLQACDGVILITPEWGGMASPAMKNFLLLCDRGELAHKPALLVGVSSNLGGAYPIAELRMTSSKNNQVCFLPAHVIVRRVKEVLNDDEQSRSEQDTFTRERMHHGLIMLAAYARALAPLRELPFSTDARFRYGM